MLKQITLAAFALTAVSALAQDSTATIDAKGAKPYDLLRFLAKDTYKKVDAHSAYTIMQFVGGLPGNYQTAVLRGLAQTAEEAQSLKTQNQTAANAMGPVGDGMSDTMVKPEGKRLTTRKLRDFDTIAMDPMAYLDYYDAIAILQKGQDQTDQGLIQDLFHELSFTRTLIPTVMNEQALDAISNYIQANAKSATPVRLKYTSLAPHTYVSPTIPR